MSPIDLMALSHRQILYLVREVCVASSGFGNIYLLISCVLIFNFRRRRETVRDVDAPVTVLKPLHGYEPRLFGRICALCTQRYSGPVQLVFGTSLSTDPAIEALIRLKAAFPERSITWQIASREQGA